MTCKRALSGILIVLVGIAFLGAAGFMLLSNEAAGAPPQPLPGPPADGDWIIEGDTYESNNQPGTYDVNGSIYVDSADVQMNNKDILVTGFVQVNETAKLTLVNCTLSFSGDVEFANYLNIFGEFVSRGGSVIESDGAYSYYFQYWEGSSGSINYTEIEGAYSLTILSSNVVIENCTIHDCAGDGIKILDSTPKVRYNTIGKNTGWGIYAKGQLLHVDAENTSTFTYGGSSNTLGRILQEVTCRFLAMDQTGTAVEGASIRVLDVGEAGMTNSTGYTLEKDLTLYGVDNTGLKVYSNFTINYTWNNGAMDIFGEHELVLADEPDTMAIPITVDIGPDLYIGNSDIAISSTTPKEGSRLEIEVVVHNGWNREVKGVKVLAEGSPHEIDRYFTILSIPANGSATAYINWTVDTFNAGGELIITITVDSDTALEGNKVDRSNNVLSISVDVKEKEDKTGFYGMVAAGVALAIIIALILVYLMMKKKRDEGGEIAHGPESPDTKDQGMPGAGDATADAPGADPEMQPSEELVDNEPVEKP